LNQKAEPATCLSAGTSVASGATPGVSSLAFVANAATGFTDLIAANAGVGDEFLLSGPSYQPTADITNAAAACTDQGPFRVAVAANAGGDMLGAGIDTHSAAPGLYYFPPNPTSAPNYVYMDSVNADSSLTTCIAAPAGCVTSLADTVVAPNGISGTGIGAGDMLVLVGDAFAGNSNPVVFRFPAAAIQSSKGCSPGSQGPCTGNSGGSRLVTQATLAQFFSQGESPVSMDLSPIDGSLLIATSAGRIYQLAPNAAGYGSPTLYATGQVGIQKIRVSQQNGSLYLFATLQSTVSSVVVFAGNAPAGGFTTPTASAPVSGTAAALAVH
jgi:hypothetical protein